MEIKKRCISLYVENRIGVLAKISGLLSGKSYNLDTLTVGETEDPTVSRMTIGMTMDDVTFEQVIKQLNRCVVVIKVIDFTEVPIHKKELLYIKVSSCSEKDKAEVFRLAKVFSLDIIDYDRNHIIVQCVKTEDANNDMIALFNKTFINRVEVVRGGSVAIEAVSTQER
ncbi:acetolactate synthase small subunit [Jutongia hominis]|uniref:Acetolactate synthase small subunit n=1 Tax=Jutongia hominis TaxID=2763664 RepID=A0ABR7MW63_9FIRM|nr:acetolactate synthase small subunit [Jutongia hominis]MBC8558048.1 acetolactate synthase small subunit [Jutongia hominis]